MPNGFDREKYLTMLGSEDFHMRETAVMVFLHIGTSDDEVDAKVAKMVRVDDQPTIRKTGIELLATRKDSHYKQLFIRCLQDEDWRVRGHAVQALQELDPNLINSQEVTEALREETHPFVRYCAKMT